MTIASSSLTARIPLVMNLDALITIQSFLDKASLLCYMQTCWTLHASGIRYLLDLDIPLRSESAVASFALFLRRESAVASFALFLRRDRKTRLFLLRKFTLEFASSSTQCPSIVKDVLLDVLRNSDRLHKLHIDGLAYSLGGDSRIISTIALLPRLQQLQLIVTRDTARSLLAELRSPVQKLDINVLDDFGDPFEALPSVARFAPSLQELTLSSLVTLTDARTSHPHAVFPHMTRLSLNGSFFRDIDPLISTFPNLLSLYVSYAHLQAHEIEDVRRANQLAQARSAWPRLDDLSGVLRALYVAAVACEVHRMSIHMVDCLDADLAKLSAVLSAARPVVLRLDFLLRLVDALPTMIPPSPRMSHLCLKINMVACPPDATAAQVLQLPLQYLSLRFFCPDWTTCDRDWFADRITVFEGMRLPAIARDLHSKCPTLRHVLLEIDPAATLVVDGATTPSSRYLGYWHVDGGAGLVEGPYDAGARVMNAVGLTCHA
ncbi:hypothetical protein OF83DRAFT_1176519 [Amylostereum chailletii]|nr:hypothetical protein OF83DRAFT_1176519 [Amylostereum chailletii]